MDVHNISNLFIYYTINLMFSIFPSPSVKIERGFFITSSPNPFPLHSDTLRLAIFSPSERFLSLCLIVLSSRIVTAPQDSSFARLSSTFEIINIYYNNKSVKYC